MRVSVNEFRYGWTWQRGPERRPGWGYPV